MIIDTNLLNAGLHPEKIHDSNTMPELALENFSIIDYSFSVINEANTDLINILVNEKVITESIGEKVYKSFNLQGILQGIVRWFCKIIGKIIDKFSAVMVDIMAMGKGTFAAMLRAKEKQLKNLDKDIKLNFPTFTFTNLTNNNPPVNLKDTFGEYLVLLKDGANDDTPEKVMKNMDVLSTAYDDMICTENHRCELLGKHALAGKFMSDEEFKEECFKFFHAEQLDPVPSTTIRGSEVWEILQKYNNANADIRKFKTENRQMQKSAENAIKDIKSAGIRLPFSPVTPKYHDAAASVNSVAAMFTKLIQHRAADIATMYMHKLEAYKDFQIQARKILVAALEANAQHAEEKADAFFR